jgi:hypothetical protein
VHVHQDQAERRRVDVGRLAAQEGQSRLTGVHGLQRIDQADLVEGLLREPGVRRIIFDQQDLHRLAPPVDHPLLLRRRRAGRRRWLPRQEEHRRGRVGQYLPDHLTVPVSQPLPPSARYVPAAAHRRQRVGQRQRCRLIEQPSPHSPNRSQPGRQTR